MARTPLFVWLARLARTAFKAGYHTEVKALSIQTTGLKTAMTFPDDVLLSRRAFLKGAAGALGGIALSSAMSWPRMALAALENNPDRAVPRNHIPPIAIVGAGLAGLVTAYRLMQLGLPSEIFEASHRVGGRIHTMQGFNREGMFVELGGELVDTGHEDIIALCEELGIPLQRFEHDQPGISPALFHSEGRLHSEAEVLEAFQPLAAALARDLRRCFPDGKIQMPTSQSPFQARWLDEMTLEAYLDGLTEVPGWLIRVIKTAYSGEYGLDPSEQSALNLLLLIGTEPNDGFRMFGESDEAMRIVGGSSRLTDALHEAIKGKVPVHSGHRLTGFAKATQGVRLAFHHRGRRIEHVADRVVVAIPFSVLRTLPGLDQSGLAPRTLECIQEWGYGTNSKQMIGFKSRFWLNGGSNVPANTGEMFTDWPSQCYWETSRLQAGNGGVLTNFLGGKAGRTAKSGQWQSSVADLDQLYQGQAKASLAGDEALMNWSQFPFAKGSYSCPRPGQYTRFAGVAAEPELDGRLWFAGEHCSIDWMGYMNGAAQSGNTVVRRLASSLDWLESRRGMG